MQNIELFCNCSLKHKIVSECLRMPQIIPITVHWGRLAVFPYLDSTLMNENIGNISTESLFSKGSLYNKCKRLNKRKIYCK